MLKSENIPIKREISCAQTLTQPSKWICYNQAIVYIQQRFDKNPISTIGYI